MIFNNINDKGFVMESISKVDCKTIKHRSQKIDAVEAKLKQVNENLVFMFRCYIYWDQVKINQLLARVDSPDGYSQVAYDDALTAVNELYRKLAEVEEWLDAGTIEINVLMENTTGSRMTALIEMAHEAITVLALSNPHYKVPSIDKVKDFLVDGNDLAKLMLVSPNQEVKASNWHETIDRINSFNNHAMRLIANPKRFFK